MYDTVGNFNCVPFLNFNLFKNPLHIFICQNDDFFNSGFLQENCCSCGFGRFFITDLKNIFNLNFTVNLKKKFKGFLFLTLALSIKRRTEQGKCSNR